MSKVTQYNAYLLSDAYYHIYNRTNNKELMFKNDENKHYFLKKYANYLYPYLKTYAYCLLDNHFHLLVQVRNEQEIKQAIVERPLEKRKKLELNYLKIHEHHTNIQNTYHLTKEDITHKLIAKSFQDFFNAYTKAFNKKHNRNGNLFNRPFKRVSIQDDTHFTQLIYYIHNNPCHHKISCLLYTSDAADE